MVCLKCHSYIYFYFQSWDLSAIEQSPMHLYSRSPLHPAPWNIMPWRNKLIQTITQEYIKSWSEKLVVHIKIWRASTAQPQVECVYSRLHSGTPKLSAWEFYTMVEQLVWALLKTIKDKECDLACCSRKPSHKMNTGQHVKVNEWILKEKVPVHFSPRL